MALNIGVQATATLKVHEQSKNTYVHSCAVILNDKSQWIATSSPNNKADRNPTNAIDNIRDSGFFHTQFGYSFPWLQVKLEKAYLINAIKMQNRDHEDAVGR